MVEFFQEFGVNPLALIAQIVNFLLLLYLLNRFLFRGVMARLDERQAKIAKGLQDAEIAAREREQAAAEREAALVEARREAQALIARATKIADDTRSEIVAEARSQAEKMTARAREEIVAEKEKAMAEIRGQVAELALLAAGKLVRRQMDGPMQRQLVEEFLAEAQPIAAGRDGS